METYLIYLSYCCAIAFGILLLVAIFSRDKNESSKAWQAVRDITVNLFSPGWISHVRRDEQIDEEYERALHRFRRAAVFMPFWSQIAWLVMVVVNYFHAIPIIDSFTPATVATLPSIWGDASLHWILRAIPMPFFVIGDGWIKIIMPVYAYATCNLYMNRKASAFFPEHNFIGHYNGDDDAIGIIGAINLLRLFKEAGSKIQPAIHSDGKRAIIHAGGTTLTTGAIIQRLDEVQTKIGCNIVTVRPTGLNDIELEYAFKNYPNMMRWEDYATHERPDFLPQGYNMVRQTGWDLSKFAHCLIPGFTGFGKTGAQITTIASAASANPNSIFIINDYSSKRGNAYKNLTQFASQLQEYWDGKRLEKDVELNPLVLLVTDPRVGANIVNTLYEEMLERNDMCGHIDARADGLTQLYKLPYYQGGNGLDVIRPRVFFVMDESASNLFTPGSHNSKNGDEDYRQTRARVNEFIGTGRSAWIHNLWSILTARFEILGNYRRQFHTISVWNYENEMKIALGIEVTMPDEVGLYAYRNGKGVSFSKFYWTESIIASEQIEAAWQECNGETRKLAKKLHEVAGKPFTQKQTEQINLDLSGNTKQPRIRSAQEPATESSRIVYGSAKEL